MSPVDRWLAVAALCLLPAGVATAAGSWVAERPGPRVAMADRDTRSAALTPPGEVTAEARIASVGWRFRLPPGERLDARLCHPAACTPLAGPRGTTQALAGLSAAAPLEFRFRLREGGQAVRVTGLQVIVNHR